MRQFVVFTLIFCFCTASSVDAQTPKPRWGHQMVYDANMKHTLIFGGSHNGQDMGDLWAWNGTSWRMLTETGPAPRIGFVLAYDKKRKETILFGGRSNERLLNDTWKWDGVRWTELKVQGPGPRAHVVGNFDPGLGGILVYGGFDVNGPLSDTWLFDGSDWKKLADNSAIGESLNQSLTYDEKEKHVVLLTAKLPENKVSETWAFKNPSWHKISDSTPINTAGTIQAIASDANNEIFLLDGTKGTSWKLVDGEYKKLNDVGPSGRSAYTMVLDSNRKKLVLFGGGVPETNIRYNDVWEWGGRQWKMVHPK